MSKKSLETRVIGTELVVTDTRTGAVTRYNYEALSQKVASKRNRPDYETWLAYLLKLEAALGVQA